MASTAEENGKNAVAQAVNFFRLDFSLRLFVFATTVAALVVELTSKETGIVLNPLTRTPIILTAKFNHSPALIYLVSALAVTCLYSIITIVISATAMTKPSPPTKLLFHLILVDVLMVGVMASATAAGGAVAYIGLKGNSHVNWRKICDVYGKFCRHIGSSVLVSLLASVALVLLVMLSTYSLYRRSR